MTTIHSGHAPNPKWEELRRAYIQHLPDKTTAIATLWQTLEAGSWDAAIVSQLFRLLHNLVGSGKSYGCAVISEVAGRAEQLIKPLLAQQTVPSSQDIIQIALVLRELQTVVPTLNVIDVPKVMQADYMYRVLIVDDDVWVAKYHAGLLEEAGMSVQTLNDPEQILSVLADTNPDLILLDMHMPNRSGLEVISLLRAQDSLAGLPIVFLSAEKRPNQQLALQTDGDDFLMKPVDPARLLSSVIGRAKRGRMVRARMMQDSLTGLLHHAAIKARLEAEVARAGRHQTALAFAIIDIDHFKNINDTYGHPVGDRVIKSLSELFQNRLRQSTVLGRYGGEEFAIIFENCTAADAVKILEDLRKDCAKLEQWSDQGTFQVTFSAGVAACLTGMDAAQLIKAADQNLYAAKHNGRNQVAV